MEDDPRPGEPSGGILLGILFLFEGSRLDKGTTSALVMEGRDVIVFRALSVPGELVAFCILAAPEDTSDGSTVRDLRNGIDLGETGGEAEGGLVGAAGCHRSNTDDFLGLAVRALSDGENPGLVLDTSNCVLAFTMVCTNPRPCSLLMLGVGSFCVAGRKNAGEGFWDGGIWGD